MNKKILISLSVVAVVAAIAIGGTIAYFSDTETSAKNLFKAGTIDIHVEGDNFTWEEGAVMEDMKPCYTDYINLTIYNDGSDPNPVNVWKKLYNFEQTTGTESEPECTDQGGVWDSSAGACDWDGSGTQYEDRNNIASIIDYDLLVEVYKGGDRIWWQTIYDKDVTVGQIRGKEIYLGMIPAGGYMKIEQSYHMQDPDYSTNWAQGDEMAFDIEIKAVQLRGTAWLDAKQAHKSPEEYWKVKNPGNPMGTLTYVVKNPTFDFEFKGTAPLTSHNYYLIAGWKATGTGYDVDTVLGSGITEANGDITITGDVELDKHMKDVKVWLVPIENWSGSEVTWGGWPGCTDNFLWEVGLIWYEDTDKI